MTRRKKNRKQSRGSIKQLDKEPDVSINKIPRASEQQSHPLAESQNISKYRLLLTPFPAAILFFLLFWFKKSTSPLDEIVALFSNSGVELILGVIGTVFTLSDTLGKDRLRKFDTLLLDMISRPARKLFFFGSYGRVTDYHKAYLGPHFFYERDVVYSVVVFLTALEFTGFSHVFWNIWIDTPKMWIEGRLRNQTYFAFTMFTFALVIHSIYRKLPFPSPIPGVFSKIIRVITHSFIIISTIPINLLRFLMYSWCYLVYAPLDFIATVSAKLKLEGYLKIVGGLMIILSLIVTYLK